MGNVVIIPTYNEKENIELIIKAIVSLPVPFDVLIIDDNSPDGTAALVKSLMPAMPNVHLIERPGKLGLGTAYVDGFHWSLEKGYTLIYEMDADFSHNPEDLVRLYNACSRDGADVVGRGAAAPADHTYTVVFHEFSEGLSKGFWLQWVNGLTIDIKRKTGIGDARDGQGGELSQVADGFAHKVRPGGAVQADHADAHALQDGQHRGNIRAKQHAPGGIQRDLCLDG